MSNGTDKFNMFENFEETNEVINDVDDYGKDEEVEIVSITMKSESRKKISSSVISRTQEEYETFIDSYYFETFTAPETGESYQVKVTVLKPEINILEKLRPAYAYSQSH